MLALREENVQEREFYYLPLSSSNAASGCDKNKLLGNQILRETSQLCYMVT